MTAAQVIEPGRVVLVRVPRPDPGAGQVRVALEGSGVCASNLPVWGGRPWFRYPLPPGALGHEGWGTVEAVGAGADPAWIGRRVAAASEHAYAEFDVVAEESLVPLPNGSPDVAPVEPFGCLFNILDRCAPERGSWLAVVGLGFIGLGIVHLAVEAGARVIAVSSRPEALARAREAGAEAALAADLRADASNREGVAVDIAELTAGQGCARVVECTGHQGPLDLAGDLVCAGGRLVIAGYHQDGPRRVDLQQWNWKGIDVINAHERSRARIRRGMQRAARALARRHEWANALVTHRFALGDLASALDRTAQRPPGFVKGAVLTGEVRS
ncbi:MAG: zinc-binding dehydrogenase [Pseudomonadota bacterium]